MAIIRRRIQNPLYVGSPNDFDDVRIDEMTQERCQGSCEALWPASMITVRETDGARLCPNDMEDGPIEIALAMAENALRAVGATPQAFGPTPFTLDSPAGVVTQITTSAGVEISQIAPIYFTAGGASQTVLLNGQNFNDAADTFAFTSGFTQGTSFTTGTTLWTLSLSVVGGTTPGDRFGMTFNGTNFRNIFRVR